MKVGDKVKIIESPYSLFKDGEVYTVMKYTNNLDTQPTFQAIKRKKSAHDKTHKPLKRSWERNDKRVLWQDV